MGTTGLLGVTGTQDIAIAGDQYAPDARIGARYAERIFRLFLSNSHTVSFVDIKQVFTGWHSRYK